MSCCEAQSNGQASSAPVTPLDATTVFEVADFAVGQPAGEVASGPLTLVDVARGRSLVFEAQRAGVTSWAIGANGLRQVGDGATATSFNSGAFSSCWIRLQLATLWNASWATALDATAIHTIEAYFDLLTFPGGLPGVAAVGWGLAAIPSNSAARMRGAARALRGGVDVAIGKTDAGEGSNYTTAPGATAQVVAAMLMPDNGTAGLVGVRASLAAGWPRYRNVPGTPLGGSPNPTSMLDENSFLAIGMWSGNAAGAAMITQLRALRIRAWR